jgi:epoxyqueuosine reductase
VALGNVGSREDLPALELAAADAEPLIAEHAAWAIGQVQARLRAAGASYSREANQLNPNNLVVASHER